MEEKPFLHLAELRANDSDFITVVLKQTVNSAQLFIALSDEDGNLSNDFMVSDPVELKNVRDFFTRVINMVDLAVNKSGATLN